MRVVVVGAGIGGLTLAGLLERDGHDVEIVEQAQQFGEVGAGILVSANGTRVLHHLGLDEELSTYGTVSERLVLRRWEDDAELLSMPMGTAPVERWGHANYSLYRPDIVSFLADRLSTTTVRFGAKAIDIEERAEGAAVILADGDRVEGDVVIGADGTHSAVRHAIIGPHPSRYSGYVAYRALVERDSVPWVPIETTNRLGPDGHVVSYFVGENQRYLNLVFITAEPDWAQESWMALGSRTTLRDAFAGWSPAVQDILDHVEDPVYRWALHDREPLPGWQQGTVTLLGDAAHPVVPFMAQGACQAIEDAAILSRCLTDASAEPQAALRRYEQIRKPRTDAVQRGSWDNATTFHLPDGPEQVARDEFYSALANPDTDALASLDWLQGYDVLAEPI